MTNPVDEYLESVAPTEKLADIHSRIGISKALIGGFRKAFTPDRLGTLAAQTGLVAGASMLIGAANRTVAAATKSSDFKAMLDVNPDLAQHHENDPKQFNQFYTS